MNYNYFNFKDYKGQYLITNDLGRFAFLNPSEFQNLMRKQLDLISPKGKELQEKGFIYDGDALGYTQSTLYPLRDVKNYVAASTSLHIFVVTTACNLKCVYCQANKGADHESLFMTEEIAQRAVDIALQSPTKQLTFEFQGGEPLLNFDVIRFIVEYSEEHKEDHLIDYTLVSNLTALTQDVIDFIGKYQISVSASIDGPQMLHDKNRPSRNGNSSFIGAASGVKRLREAGIPVGAIETTTRDSLSYPKDIVHTYADMGFNSIFIRPLTPLGKAGKAWEQIGYTSEEFIEFYKEALEECLRINDDSRFFSENHATIFLKRIFGETVNYMELRSPCGAGFGQLAYYSDGNIFTCDEARMVYEMGSDAFLLGNVWEFKYGDLMKSSVCRTVCKASMLETIPGCSDCVYQPYCGTCPVISYANTGDVLEKAPRNYRCKIYMGMLDCLFEILQKNDKDTVRVLRSWSN